MKFPSKFVSILFVLMIGISLLGPAGISTTQQPLHAQPELLEMARSAPDQMVPVIVQAKGDMDALGKLLAGVSDSTPKALYIIHAYTARIRAGKVVEVAASPLVKWVSLDAPMHETVCTGECVTAVNLKTAYIASIRADKVWAMSTPRQGKGIGVAVVDSGINWQQDLYTLMGQNRVVANVRFNNDYNQTTFDNFGHGSHVAGVVGGNGRSSNGYYIGVAPQSSIINVKVSNDDGSTTASQVVEGLQWIYDNRAAYNIRVVNLSLNSSMAESYHTSPLTAAVEVLWFNGIVVVVSAGNNGSATLYPPANDPFVITVGAADDKGTAHITDDVVASFSAFGKTEDGFAKPDLVAPGKNIVSLMGNTSGVIPAAHPANRIGNTYFKMSGTSTAAPMVAGAVALLLEDEPALSPDQVKARLKATANKKWAGYTTTKAGAGYLDVYAALMGTTTSSANTGIEASRLLWTGDEPVAWNSVAWNSVAWNSVAWNSVAWNSVAWNSVAWNSDYWGE